MVRGNMTALGAVFLAGGLLVRSQYRAALTGRALATAGSVLVLPRSDNFRERIFAELLK